MILTMKQTESCANRDKQYLEYQLYDKTLLKVFRAQHPPLFKLGTLEVNFSGQLIGTTNINVVAQTNLVCPEGFNERKINYLKKLEDGSSYSISKTEYRYYIDNNCIGVLRYCTRKPKSGLFSSFKAYPYYEMEFRNNFYKIYDIRDKKIGINCVVYQNDKIVACIDRNLKVVNYLENYTIYSDDNIDIDALFLIACHFDYCDSNEPNFPEATVTSVQNGNSYVEYRKELLSKYDPNFKKKKLEEFIVYEEAKRNNNNNNV